MRGKEIAPISMRPLLDAMGRMVTRSWGPVLLAALAVTALSVHFGGQIRLETDVMSLLPAGDRAVSDFMRTAQLFGSERKLIVLVESEENVSSRIAAEFMNEFAAGLRQCPLVTEVDYRLPVVSVNEHARNIEDRFDISHAFYENAGGNAALMFVSAREPSGDTGFARELMDRVYELEHEARRSVKGNVTGLKVGYAGGYPIALGESESMERNIKVTILTSLGCVLFVFFLSFKRIGTLVCVGTALIMGMAWTLLAAFLAVGSLNIISIAFAAVLAGLGVDFGIHVTNRFLCELGTGNTPVVAVRNTLNTTGEGVFLGCITTSAAFYALTITGFRGAVEFGFLVGTGVFLCMISMLTVLPALLLLWSSLSPKPAGQGMDDTGFALTSRFMDKFGRLSAATLVIAASVWVSAVFGTQALPRFDNSLTAMSSSGNRAVQVQHRILALFGNRIEPLTVAATGKDPAATVGLSRAVTARAMSLEESGKIERVESVFRYVPSESSRTALLDKMGDPEERGKALDYLIRRLRRDETKREEYEFLSQRRDVLVRFLEHDLLPESLSFDELRHVMPETLFAKFFAFDAHSDTYAAAIYVYPTHRIVDEDGARNMEAMLGVGPPGLTMSGMSLLVGRLQRLITGEFRFVTLLISGVLIAMLVLIYRRMSLVLATALCLMLSLALTLTVMTVFDINLNYINIMAFPLILGMGIDDSIHMIYRYFENGERSIRNMIRSTGRPVFLTSATTMCGFGSLIFTDHGGLVSLGIVVMTGIGACLVMSMFVLPGLVAAWTRK